MPWIIDIPNINPCLAGLADQTTHVSFQGRPEKYSGGVSIFVPPVQHRRILLLSLWLNAFLRNVGGVISFSKEVVKKLDFHSFAILKFVPPNVVKTFFREI